jgi:hypothetical protein
MAQCLTSAARLQRQECVPGGGNFFADPFGSRRALSSAVLFSVTRFFGEKNS